MEKELNDFLNEIEREKVSHFLDDVILKEALRKVLLKYIYSDGVLMAGKPANPYENFALNIYKDQSTGVMFTDEELGHLTKVRRFAIELVQKAFTSLEDYRKVKTVDEKAVNRAR